MAQTSIKGFAKCYSARGCTENSVRAVSEALRGVETINSNVNHGTSNGGGHGSGQGLGQSPNRTSS